MITIATIIVVVGLLFTYSILKAGSDADDILLGERQYDETN